MEQFQISSTVRHLRFIYFVKSDISYDDLVSVILKNQAVWGGRYNPIIPVSDGVITDEYLKLIEFLDPDYVVAQNGVDLEMIKRLRLFNPVKYLRLDDRGPESVGSTNFSPPNAFGLGQKKLVYIGLHEADPLYRDFIKINLGVGSDTTWGEVFQAATVPNTIVLQGDQTEHWFKLLFENQPIDLLQKSTKRAFVKTFRPKNYSGRKSLEVVVSAGKENVSDLFYYWNRKLYEDQTVVFLTVEQLTLFLTDKFFQEALRKWTWYDVCKFKSGSLSEDQLSQLLDGRLTELKKSKHIEVEVIQDFPFEIQDASLLYDNPQSRAVDIQLLQSNNGLYFVPSPDQGYSFGEYAVDTKIKKFESSFQEEVLFPLTTEVRYIFSRHEGRVNRGRDITLFYKNNASTNNSVEIKIPDSNSLFRQLIVLPVIDGEKTENPNVKLIWRNDPSQRLSGFLELFRFNFVMIDEFLSDIFWLEIFEKLCQSRGAVGNTITFSEIQDRAIAALGKKRITLVKKEKGWCNLENLGLGLKDTLEELCECQVFFKGFTIKCSNCSSKHWYSLDQVGSSLKCNGCQVSLNVPVEPTFSYKLNELVKTNMFDANGNHDGNYTVIGTLVSLYHQSHRSFSFSSQLELFADHHYRKIIGDLDIVCVSDGKLIIGEAKYDSKDFKAEKSKCLKTLAEIAKAVRPDTIVLSCSVNQHERLERAKKSLIGFLNDWPFVPNVEILEVSKADDYHVGERRYFRY